MWTSVRMTTAVVRGGAETQSAVSTASARSDTLSTRIKLLALVSVTKVVLMKYLITWFFTYLIKNLKLKHLQ